MTDKTNPYHPPNSTQDVDPKRVFVGRRAVLALPVLIPLFAHMLSRTVIPADDSPFHAIFTFGAILPAFFLACSIPDKLLPVSRKIYTAACVLSALLVAATLIAFPIT